MVVTRNFRDVEKTRKPCYCKETPAARCCSGFFTNILRLHSAQYMHGAVQQGSPKSPKSPYGRRPQIFRWYFNVVSYSFRYISISGFVGYFRLSIIHEIAREYFLRFLSGNKTPQVKRRSFDDIYYIFGDIRTSGLCGHIAISGCWLSSKLLFLNSTWSILQGLQFRRDIWGYFTRNKGA